MQYLNSHDEKEWLKLSIYIKDGMKQLNSLRFAYFNYLYLFLYFWRTPYNIMMMYYLSYVFVQFMEIQ